MRFDVVVLAGTHLVRQLVRHCLVPLGGRVHEFSTPEELLPRLQVLAADLLVVDTDGMGRRWRLAARAAQLGLRLPVVLLAGRFGFEDAHDALLLGVSAVVLKPFRKEEHASRLYDLVLRHRGVRPRRREPRFAPGEELAARLDYRDRDGAGVGLLDDVARAGIGVALRGEKADRLPAGAVVDQATLSVGLAAARVSARVVHRAADRAGLSILEWGDGRQKVLRLIEELASRAFGSRRAKRRW